MAEHTIDYGIINEEIKDMTAFLDNGFVYEIKDVIGIQNLGYTSFLIILDKEYNLVILNTNSIARFESKKNG